MEITRISDKDGIVVYERQRGGKIGPKYVVVNGITGAVIGEARKRKGAEKLAGVMRKAQKALSNAGSMIPRMVAPDWPDTCPCDSRKVGEK